MATKTRPTARPKAATSPTKRRKAAKRPVATTKRPVATKKRPAATAKRPVATTKRPVATKKRPVATKKRPVATKKRPVATKAAKHATTAAVKHTAPTKHAAPAKRAAPAKHAAPAPAATSAKSPAAPTERIPSGRGGWRPGAGRPPKGERAGSPHKERPELDADYPLHIILRSLPVVGSLRRHDMYLAIRRATQQVDARAGFHIVHISLAPDALHLLIEADDKLALARGMQAFQISAAKHVNRAFSRRRPGPRRRGPVFPDRYHAEPLTTPREARDALLRILNGWRTHKADRDPAEATAQRTWKLDWYSSAPAFPDWSNSRDARLPPPDHAPLHVHPPESDLLKDGWKQAGRTISRTEAPPPSPDQRPAR